MFPYGTIEIKVTTIKIWNWISHGEKFQISNTFKEDYDLWGDHRK